MKDVCQCFYETGVIPVVVLDTPEQAVPLARALLEGGLPVMEVTFRTAAAEESIRRIAREVPEILVGAGTVLDRNTAAVARDAGAQFIVSPGLNPDEAAYCLEQGLPVFSGVATATELQAAVCAGLTAVKFFPAEQMGGPGMLKALGAAFPNVRFMPTGGVRLENLESYLSLPNVMACGGSWVCPVKLLRGGEYGKITALCREARAEVERVRSGRR